MASIERPLLTIAIPTFNRADLLSLSLSCIAEAAKGYEDYIEVIISDNCSTDNTGSVIQQAQKLFPFKYFKNVENVGFNYNYIKLIDEYANGTYCWVMGDDDLIHPNAIKKVVETLNAHPDLSFIYVKFDFKSQAEVLKTTGVPELRSSENITGTSCTFNELISKVGAPGNLMLTFISSAIFRNELMKAIDKKEIARESWSTFYNLFPHSYFYARVMANRSAFVFNSPLITALVHEKSWDSKAWMLYLKFIPELYQHYLDNGFDAQELRMQEKLIIKAGVPYLFLGILSKWRIKWEFLCKYATDAVFYSSLTNGLKRKLFGSSAN